MPELEAGLKLKLLKVWPEYQYLLETFIVKIHAYEGKIEKRTFWFRAKGDSTCSKTTSWPPFIDSFILH